MTLIDFGSDECDCGQCDAPCEHPRCAALADIIDDYSEGWCAKHWDEKRDREAEQSEEEFASKWHRGLSPYLYHGERYEAAHDAYLDARIDEARGK